MRTCLMAAVAAVLWIPQAPIRRPPLIREITASTDVAWLERLGTDLRFAEEEYRVRGANTAGVKGNRSAAYVRLGALASTESLAAVTRIEAAMHDHSTLAPPATPGTPFYHPAPHMTDMTWMFNAKARLNDGRDVAAAILDLYGPPCLFLATQAGGQWSRPLMVPLPVPGYPGVTIAGVGGDRVRVGFLPQPQSGNPMSSIYPSPDAVEVLLSEIQKDTDGDGWTDIAERHLGTSWQNADTDRDGIPDDRDPAPTYRERPTDKTDEDVQILRRAVFAMFGLTAAPGALFVADSSRQLQLDGLPGPVIYHEGNGSVRVTWKILSKTPTEATVEITDFEGALAGSGNDVKLRKIDDAWYVVSVAMKWIS